MKYLENPLSSKRPTKRLLGTKRTKLPSVANESVEQDVEGLLYYFNGLKLDRKSFEIAKFLVEIFENQNERYAEEDKFTHEDIERIVGSKLRKRNDIIGHSIKLLEFSNYNLSDDDIERLTKFLPGSSVRELRLYKNQIGDAGAIFLSKILKDTKIEILSLGQNNIGDTGASAILSGLEGSSIYYLDLVVNPISNEVKSEFKKMESVNLRIHI